MGRRNVSPVGKHAVLPPLGVGFVLGGDVGQRLAQGGVHVAGDVELLAEAEARRRKRLARPREGGAVEPHLPLQRRQGGVAGDGPGIRRCAHALDHLVVAGRHHDGRARLLERARGEADVVQMEVLAVEGHRSSVHSRLTTSRASRKRDSRRPRGIPKASNSTSR